MHRRVTSLVAALTAILLPLSASVRVPAATFTTMQLPGPGAGEPGISLAPDGTIYVNAPAGTGRIWRGSGSAFDVTNNFDRLSIDTGDTDLQVAPDDGTVYAVNLSTAYALSNLAYVSRDGGASYSGPAWAGTNSDRPWIAAGTGGVSYIAYHDFVPTGGPDIVILRSNDFGRTYLPQGDVTIGDPVAFGESLTICGNTLSRPYISPADPNTLYMFFGAGDAVACGTMLPTADEIAINQVWFARSTDAGRTWTTKMIHGMLTPGGSSTTHLMPSGAVGADGTIYTVWAEAQSGGNTHVKLMRSSDGGNTWQGPFAVDQAAGNHSNVFPAVTAGAAGRVDVVWYASSADSFNDGNAQWVVEDARSTTSGTAFAQSQVSSGVVHSGGICQAGLFCLLGGNRNLLDFIDVKIDTAGRANVVWSDDTASDPRIRTFLGIG